MPQLPLGRKPTPRMLDEHDREYLHAILSKPISPSHVGYYRKVAQAVAGVASLLEAIASIDKDKSTQRATGAAFLIVDVAASRARDSLGQSARAF